MTDPSRLEDTKSAGLPDVGQSEITFDGTATLTVQGSVVLIPAPSADPRGLHPLLDPIPRLPGLTHFADPLNLPWWRKVFILVILTTFPEAHHIYLPTTDAVSGLCLISSLGALIVYMQDDYIQSGITSQQISDLFTYPSLFLGIGNIVSMPLAVSFGRRPVILASTILLFVSCIVCATNTGYHGHLGGRMLAAFSAAQCQALVLLMIQDIFFLHQRARAIQCYSSAEIAFNCSLVIGASYMANDFGWRSAYWLFAAMSGSAMILTFLFVPETYYDRPIAAFTGSPSLDPPSVLDNSITENTSISNRIAGAETRELNREDTNKHGSGSAARYLTITDPRPLDVETFPPRTWKSDLRILVHKPHLGNFWTCLKQIGTVFLFPHVLWVAVNNGIFQGIDVSIQMTYGAVLTAPPYNWPNTTVSLIQLGQLAVAAISLPLIGSLGDWGIKFAARRNKGVHEPEYRLVTIVLPLILAIILTVIYGYAVADPWHYHWFALVVTIDAYLFIILSASTAGTTYVIDSHPKRAGAMLVVLPLTRGLVGFGISYHTAEYIKNIGAVATFGIYAGVSALVGVLGLVLFWKGKLLRHFCA
ncbi:MFS transporter, partial [Fusarium albosuccineum]